MSKSKFRDFGKEKQELEENLARIRPILKLCREKTNSDLLIELNVLFPNEFHFDCGFVKLIQVKKQQSIMIVPEFPLDKNVSWKVIWHHQTKIITEVITNFSDLVERLKIIKAL